MDEKEEISIIETILELKHADPFVPFSLVLASGDRFLIETGENLVEMRSQFFYVSPKTDKFCFLRKSQIVAVEDENKPRTQRSRRKAS